MTAAVSQAHFGQLPDGRPVDLFTLANSRGAVAQITNYGGIITSLRVPDKRGEPGDVVLGCDRLDGYLKNNAYLGALIGRYGNRIAKAQFTLAGQTHRLAANNGPNSLHGGVQGFDKILWHAQPAVVAAGPALELTYLSRDGEEGYPGNLAVTARYTLTEDNALRLDFTANTDRATVFNPTQHSYFNLAGRGDVLGHEIYLNADRFTPVDSTLIPTGERRLVAGTPLDFRQPTAIGARIGQADEQLKLGRGYDHNFILNKTAGELALAARVTEAVSGRVLEVFTTEPGVQFYSGNFLDGSIAGKGGWNYQCRHGFCIEPQHFPDSPNRPDFPSTVLHPGEVFQSAMLCRFSVR